MTIPEILEKARKHVPFVRERSRVEFVDRLLNPYGYPHRSTHRWCHGWREEGELFLNENLDIVGVLAVSDSNGQGKTYESQEIFPAGRPAFVLSYVVKFDTEEEEYAILCRAS